MGSLVICCVPGPPPPGTPTAPVILSRQNNYGYGNYLIEKSLRREAGPDGEEDVLWFSRVVSTWNGIDSNRYGASVFHAVLNFGELASGL